MFFAHSSDPTKGIPAQEYAAHICGVVNRARKAADNACRYGFYDGELLRKIVPLAGEFHDLGKLDK